MKLALAFILLASPALAELACKGEVLLKGNDRFERFEVEIAATPGARAEGLMHREEMDARQGMLFLYANEAERNFWMKNTPLPLDILFYDQEGARVMVQENAKPYDETPLAGGVAMAALELNAGSYKKFELEELQLSYRLPLKDNCPELAINHPLRREGAAD